MIVKKSHNQDLWKASMFLGQRTTDKSMAAIAQVTEGSSSPRREALLAIRKVLLVRASVVLAFDYFARDISQWWPTSGHSGGCSLECKKGGRIYEIEADDRIRLWGHVTDWQPPFHLGLAWAPDQVNHIGIGTEVQLDFSSNGSDRTRVEFLHHGWQLDQIKHYTDYRKYWEGVLIDGYQDYVRRRRL
jgi:hypothetical protein